MTPRPDLRPACVLAQAHPKLAEAYLTVWHLAHSDEVLELDRRIARLWLARMTVALEAVAGAAPDERRTA